MKKNSIIIAVTFCMMLVACEKEPYINYGFDSAIHKDSKGLVIAAISHHVQNLYLKGSVRLAEGSIEINLLNPHGDTVHSRTIIAPNDLSIDESFEAQSGYWKLKYLSTEGVGEIDLHLQKY